MKKIIACLLFVTAIANDVVAQDEFDALRYSYTNYLGTARGMGIGGALGSIGADFSTLSVNPAGIGVYKSSELMFSPSFTVSGNKGSYLGTQVSANDSKFNIANFGIVITNNLSAKSTNKTKWKTFNFGAGLNRVATFKNEIGYSGKNYNNSLTESFADDFNSLGGINSNSLNNVGYSAYGAYQTYLVDRGIGLDSNKAVSYVPYSAGLNQTKRVFESGGMTEFVISAGGNYMDKLMIGATLGIISLRYDKTMQFDETDISGDPNNDFKYMNYTENLSTTGTGLNLKLGAIYKPNAQFRIGLAFHTPTHIELNDASYISIESHTDSLLLQTNPSASPVRSYSQDSALVFNYSLNTPYKAILSAMMLFGRIGFLTADMEYVNYASMRYNYGILYEKQSDEMNQVIQNTYQQTLNLRLGAEARLKNVSLRGGFAYYGSPQTKNEMYSPRTNITAGVGYRQQYWFIDASFTHSIQKNKELPYILARSNANVQTASIENSRNVVAVTLGVKF